MNIDVSMVMIMAMLAFVLIRISMVSRDLRMMKQDQDVQKTRFDLVDSKLVSIERQSRPLRLLDFFENDLYQAIANTSQARFDIYREEGVEDPDNQERYELEQYLKSDRSEPFEPSNWLTHCMEIRCRWQLNQNIGTRNLQTLRLRMLGILGGESSPETTTESLKLEPYVERSSDARVAERNSEDIKWLRERSWSSIHAIQTRVRNLPTRLSD